VRGRSCSRERPQGVDLSRPLEQGGVPAEVAWPGRDAKAYAGENIVPERDKNSLAGYFVFRDRLRCRGNGGAIWPSAVLEAAQPRRLADFGAYAGPNATIRRESNPLSY
jgi:hypothetical protein